MFPRLISLGVLGLALTGCASVPAPPSAPHPLLEQSGSFRAPDSLGQLLSIPKPDSRAVIVDFWATDCGPCRQAVPRIVSKSGELRSHHVQLALVGVLRDDETVESARSVLASWGVVTPFVVDRGGTIQRQLRVMEIPATLVLDRKGTVRWFSPPGATAEEIVQAALQVAESGE